MNTFLLGQPAEDDNRPSSKQIYNVDERETILVRMRSAAFEFYKAAIQTNCHPFIEFTGLMNEYIKICERAHNNGIDFTNCSKHSGNSLPIESFEVAYINEKLECIFTGRIFTKGELR